MQADRPQDTKSKVELQYWSLYFHVLGIEFDFFLVILTDVGFFFIYVRSTNGDGKLQEKNPICQRNK